MRFRDAFRRKVCADFEIELVEFSSGNNHVRLLANFLPKVAVSKPVNFLKGVPSHHLRQSAGLPLSIVRRYIEIQNRLL
ncbi:transposase [Streptomyces sp. NBC_00190]|uniref:transposase n=1 Tax=unclassified Streptomyces TaxID=2593676 RepID=UPI002E2E6B9A|nr:transposase [Streptomyces sp. NBC_00190]WSZ40541.1 transposase [Streptomyces sp. NBC_00868]